MKVEPKEKRMKMQYYICNLFLGVLRSNLEVLEPPLEGFEIATGWEWIHLFRCNKQWWYLDGPFVLFGSPMGDENSQQQNQHHKTNNHTVPALEDKPRGTWR